MVLLGVESSALNFTGVLELSDEFAVSPSDGRGQITESAVFAVWAKTKVAESIRDNHALNLVIRVRYTIEDLQSLEGGSTALGLVRHHTTDGAPQHLRGSTIVDGTLLGVGVHALAKEHLPLH